MSNNIRTQAVDIILGGIEHSLLREGSAQYDRNIAEDVLNQLLEINAIPPLFNVGDTVYMVLPPDEENIDGLVSAERITEVCTKGFFISSFVPPENDLGLYISYDALGTTIFRKRQQAEKALSELIHHLTSEP